MIPLPRLFLLLSIGTALLVPSGRATNPLILDQFTADPTARVFEGRLYVYPSHDIPAPPDYKGRPNWFAMEDYHVFSSDNLTDWQDHGVILRQTEVPWVDATTYSFWAPDCIGYRGKYYLFFPALGKTHDGFHIGVAVADHPTGPFKPEPAPIAGVNGIDPCVLIDRDGSAYLYHSHKQIFVVRLKENLLERDGPVKTLENLPRQGLLEGPFAFVRNGIYYLTYPHVEHERERLEYAMGSSPLGPFKPAGVLLDESASGCWTVHQSIVEYQGQWYLFYHDNDLSPEFDKHRSIRADRLFFNADGTIQKVVPTLRGVGRVAARSPLQIDRYSATSGSDVTVAFLDPASPRDGWKVALPHQAAWVRFNEVDFGGDRPSSVSVRARSTTGATIEIRRDSPDGIVLARVEVAPGASWQTVSAAVKAAPTGIHDLVVALTSNGSVEVDWVRFQ